jgi:hypothetical protein
VKRLRRQASAGRATNYQKEVNQEVLVPIIDKLDELITVLKSIAQHNK